MKLVVRLIPLVLFVLFTSCLKNDSVEAGPASVATPTISTTPLTGLTSSTVTTGGNVTGDGATVTLRGICYSHHSRTLITENMTTAGSGTGSFTINLTGLKRDSVYFVRAFAINSGGASYGEEIRFTPIYTAGESLLGGKICYVDNTRDHGYIAAIADQSGGTAWGCASTLLNGVNGTILGTGEMNTINIISACKDPGIAAQVCFDLGSDWFLPSKAEMDSIYKRKDAIGGFTNSPYWTSTQVDANNAYSVDFSTGIMTPANKSNSLRVRAIRAF